MEGLDDCASSLYIKVPQAVGTSASGGDMGGGGGDSGEGKKSGVTLNGMPTMFEDLFQTYLYL